MSFGINGLLQSQGDTVSMQRGQIAAFFANIALNPLLMFGIPGVWGGMGFDGIALSTVISQSGIMIYVGYRVFRTDLLAGVTRACFRPEISTYRAITTQMLPTTMTMFVMMSAGFIVQYYLKSFGTSAVRGLRCCAAGRTAVPVACFWSDNRPAAHCGAELWGRHEWTGSRRRCSTAGNSVGSSWWWPVRSCFSHRHMLMRIVLADPDVIRIGVSYLRVDGFILPIYMMLFAINSFLQALKAADLDLLDRGLQAGLWGCLLQLCLCRLGRFWCSWRLVRHRDGGSLRVVDFLDCRRICRARIDWRPEGDEGYGRPKLAECLFWLALNQFAYILIEVLRENRGPGAQ